jgi:hypothetical protein
MRHTHRIPTRLALGAALSVGLAGPLWACLTNQACAAETAAVETKPDLNKVSTHLKAHVSYPATRAQLLAACAQMSEFTAGEKAWFAARLPNGTYKSASEVLAAIGK